MRLRRCLAAVAQPDSHGVAAQDCALPPVAAHLFVCLAGRRAGLHARFAMKASPNAAILKIFYQAVRHSTHSARAVVPLGHPGAVRSVRL